MERRMKNKKSVFTNKHKYACHCGFGTTSENRMRQHIRTRHAKYKYICKICRSKANTLTKIETHFELEHRKANISCSVEEDVKWTKRLVTRARKKLKICSFCSYQTSGYILWHCRKHQDKNFRCAWCDFSNHFKFFVKIHGKLKHPFYEPIVLNEATGRICQKIAKKPRQGKQIRDVRKRSGTVADETNNDSEESGLDSGYLSETNADARVCLASLSTEKDESSDCSRRSRDQSLSGSDIKKEADSGGDMPTNCHPVEESIDSANAKGYLQPGDVITRQMQLTGELLYFSPITDEWQDLMSAIVGLNVCGPLISGDAKLINRTSAPSTVRLVEKDGNCFFRSLSTFLTGSEGNYCSIRRSLVEFMIDNGDEFQKACVVACNMLDYIELSDMELDMTWATEVEVTAAATMLQTPIVIFACHGSTRCWVEYPPAFLTDYHPALDCAIYLLHQENHFEPVLDVNPFLDVG